MPVKDIESIERLEARIARMSTPNIVDQLSKYAVFKEIDQDLEDIIAIMSDVLVERIIGTKLLDENTDEEIGSKMKLFFGSQNINQIAGSIGRIFLINYRAHLKATRSKANI